MGGCTALTLHTTHARINVDTRSSGTANVLWTVGLSTAQVKSQRCWCMLQHTTTSQATAVVSCADFMLAATQCYRCSTRY